MYGSVESASSKISEVITSTALWGLCDSQEDEGQPVKAMQNVANALLRLEHYELALGYASAVTRIKAQYQAAKACHHMKDYVACQFYLCQVHSWLYIAMLCLLMWCTGLQAHPFMMRSTLCSFAPGTASCKLLQCAATLTLVALSQILEFERTPEVLELIEANNAALPSAQRLAVTNMRRSRITAPMRAAAALLLAANIDRFLKHAVAEHKDFYTWRLAHHDPERDADLKVAMAEAKDIYLADDLPTAMRMWRYVVVSTLVRPDFATTRWRVSDRTMAADMLVALCQQRANRKWVRASCSAAGPCQASFSSGFRCQDQLQSCARGQVPRVVAPTPWHTQCVPHTRNACDSSLQCARAGA
jgi:hypothetical protein